MPMPVTRSRSGRTLKAPERYEPKEEIIDDYTDDESDVDDDEDIEDEDEYHSDDDDEEDDDDEDADEHGNLKDFVVYSDEEEEDEDE